MVLVIVIGLTMQHILGAFLHARDALTLGCAR